MAKSKKSSSVFSNARESYYKNLNNSRILRFPNSAKKESEVYSRFNVIYVTNILRDLKKGETITSETLNKGFEEALKNEAKIRDEKENARIKKEYDKGNKTEDIVTKKGEMKKSHKGNEFLRKFFTVKGDCLVLNSSFVIGKQELNWSRTVLYRDGRLFNLLETKSGTFTLKESDFVPNLIKFE